MSGKINKRFTAFFAVLVALLLSTGMVLGDVVINEVMVDPDEGDEWVELYNNGDESVDISSYTIEDSTGASVIDFADGDEIAAEGYFTAESTNKFNNDGDHVILKDAGGEAIDSFTYGDADRIVDVTHIADDIDANRTVVRIPNGESDGGFKVAESGRATKNESNNEAPASADGIPDQTLNENVEDEDSVTVDLTEHITDADGDDLTFLIDDDADPDADCNIIADDDGNDDVLEISLEADWTDSEVSCTVQADDGFETEDFEVNITITPALQILTDTIRINGDEYNDEEFNVTPGEEVTIAFDYINNGDDRLGLVDFTHTVEDEDGNDVDLDDLEEAAGDLLMASGDTNADEYTFTVPYSIPEDNFTFEFSVKGFDVLVNEYESDAVALEFTVNKEEMNVHLDEETLELTDDELTCTRETELTFTLTNNGEEVAEPKILVYSEEGSGDLSADGEFNFGDEDPTVSFEKDYDELADSETDDDDDTMSVGEEVEITIDIDASELVGAQTLYLYLVDPFFPDDTGLIGPFEIPFEVGDCLNTAAINAEMVVERASGGEAKIADLTKDDEEDDTNNYLYLIENVPVDEEDEREEYEFEFGPVEHSVEDEEENVVCEAQGTELRCNQVEGKEAWHGTEEKNLTIKETTTGSEFVESFTVTVNPTLEFEDVGSPESESVGEELRITFKLNNNLDKKLIRVGVELTDEDGSDSFDDIKLEGEKFHINANSRSATHAVVGNLPADTFSGEYDLVLTAKGETETGEDFSGSYELTLEVVREATEVVLEAELVSEGDVEDANTFSCKAEAEIDVTLTNTGEADEEDIVIIVREGNEVLYDSGDVLEEFIGLDSGDDFNSQEDLGGPITLPVRGQGAHNFVVEVLYNFAGDSPSSEERGEAASPDTSSTIRVSKTGCLDLENFEPELSTIEVPWVTGVGGSIEFKVSLKEGGDDNLIEWFVDDLNLDEDDDTPAVETGEEFKFENEFTEDPSTYLITAIYNGDEDDGLTWVVVTTDVPISFNLIIEEFPDDVTPDDLELFEDFTVSNSKGMIAFDNVVNLRGIWDLDEHITIGNGFVSVENDIDETGVANRFDSSATVTLKNIAQGKTVIYKYDDFGNPAELENRETCTFNEADESGCKAVSHIGTDFIFTVDSFSTYEVVTELESDLTVSSEIFFDDVNRGTTVTKEFTIQNVGTIDAITDITYDMSAINARYSPTLTNAVASLNPGQSQIITLQVTIPSNENAGKHSIGNVKVNSKLNGEALPQKTLPVHVSTKTFLKIENIEINGKTSGDLSIDEENEIEVEVKNEYTEDMEEVTVTVEILDVDNDDLEEESDEFDLNSGDDDKVTLDFDLRGENVDEDSYRVRVTVEGEADDGSKHEAVEIKTVDVDIEKHKIIIDRVTTSASTLQCLRHTTIQVDVENVGKSNEDEVEIRVRNTALGLDQIRENIELDKFSRSDNDHRATFSLNLENAAAGTYPITVEVSRDGSTEESEEVIITVQDCLTNQATTGQSNVLSGQANDALVQSLQQQLQQQLLARQQLQSQPDPVVTTSFRESGAYTTLLGVLVVLVFIAVILAFVVLFVRKPKA